MRFLNPVFLVIVAGIVGLGLLRVTLVSLNTSKSPPGCQPLTSDGAVDPTQTVAFWLNRPINPGAGTDDRLAKIPDRVLGETSDQKWIEIDLSTQKLIAHEGDKIFLESYISSGLWNKTPPGQYRIWYKTRSTKMEGGNKLNSTYYYLPNVPYNMFFYGDYGIHGTYWHNNFGRPMSHGCVNAPTTVAKDLFYWTDPPLPPGKNTVKSTSSNPGTRVVVHD